MTDFWLLSGLLVALGVIAIVWPIWRQRRQSRVDRAAVVRNRDRCSLPAGTRPDAARILQRGEEIPRDEGIVGARQPVPGVARQRADRIGHADPLFARAHASPSPSAIGASACSAARARWAASRTR